MEKTAKRIGIAIVAILLVALVCAGIALSLPQAETPLASEGSANGSLSTALKSVTADDVTYDLSDWEQANDYYDYLVKQGYEGLEGQDALESWGDEYVSKSDAKIALRPYNDSGTPYEYQFGGNSGKILDEDGNPVLGYDGAEKYNGLIIGYDDVFSGTLDGCGAQVSIIVATIDETLNSYQLNSTEAKEILADNNATTMFDECGESCFMGGFANIAANANVSNLNMVYKTSFSFANDVKNKGIYAGGLFGAMMNSTVNNCSVVFNEGVNIRGHKGMQSSSVGAGVGTEETAGYNTIAFGGIAAYVYAGTVSNCSVDINASIKLDSQGVYGAGWFAAVQGGVLRAFVGGMVGISQGITMYNIVATNSGNGASLMADVSSPWRTDRDQLTRAGAILGVSLAAANATSDANTLGWSSGLPSQLTTINGIISDFDGAVGHAIDSDNDGGWKDQKGVLFGSVENVVTNLYYRGSSVPTDLVFFGVGKATVTPISVTTDQGSVDLGFENNTVSRASEVASVPGPMAYYTAPSTEGSILWTYTLNDTSYDTHSEQGHSSYAVQLDRSAPSTGYTVAFETGRSVTYQVWNGNDNIHDRYALNQSYEYAVTKTFDNVAFSVPTLKIFTLSGGNSGIADITDAKYWTVSGAASSFADAKNAGTYNIRLTANYDVENNYAYDFVDDDQNIIAYKSVNSNGNGADRIVREYKYVITQRDITLSINQPDFVYDGQVKQLSLSFDSLVEGYAQPALDAVYSNSMSVVDAASVIDADTYTLSVSGVVDPNYNLVNASDFTAYEFEIRQREITLVPSGYTGFVYNGSEQVPSLDIENAITEGDTSIVNITYYNHNDLNAVLATPDDRRDAGQYQMRVALADTINYVLADGEQLEGVTYQPTQLIVDYEIAKAPIVFEGTPDNVYTFTYNGSMVNSLALLNNACATSYYFQPQDPANTLDYNLGAGGDPYIKFNVTSGGLIAFADTYEATLSYVGHPNFKDAYQDITIVVAPRALSLNFDTATTGDTSFEYGRVPEYGIATGATGAIAADGLNIEIVYYKDSVSQDNSLGTAVPTDVGSYVASIEVTGAEFAEAIDSYTVSPDSASTIEFEITKKDITVAYDGTMSFVYDGTAHSDVSVTSVEGIIASEQDLYNAGTLKVTYTKDGSTADTARNAGDYTLGAAPTADDNGAFVNNYNVATVQTFTVEQAPLTITLQEYSASYADTVGTIPCVEGEGGTYIVTAGEIFGDDRTDAEGDDLFVVTITDGPITGLGVYNFTMALNADNSNAANYDLTVNGSGVIHVEGTPVFAGVYVYDESGEIVGSGFADEAAEGAYDITVSVVYGAQTYRAEFGTRTTAGSIEGISFDDPSSVTGDATSGKSGNGYPYISARNAGNYTAVFTLAADAQGKFYFPGNGEESAYSINVTFVIKQREVTVTPNAVEQTYGEEFQDAGYSVADDDGSIAAMLAADGFAPTYTSETDASTAANTTGKVTLTQAFAAGSEGNANNYVFTTEEGSVTVVPRPVTVSVTTSGSAVYGDGAPEITAIAAAEGSKTIIEGDADGLITGLNADGVLDLANRNVGSTKIVIVEGKNAIGNYTVTLAEDTGVVQVTPKKISVDVADGIVPYGATEADIRPANGVYFNGEPEFAYDDATKEFVFKIAGGGVDLTTQEPDTIASVLQIAFVDETLNGNYEFEFTNGDLTVEAMTLEAGQVRVELEKDTYDGSVIGYDIFVGTVNVTDADPTRLVVTINGSVDTEIKDAGEYVFAIEGDGEYYQGTVTVTVTVKQADISVMDFGLDKTSATYTGSEIEVKANTAIAVSLAVTQDGKEAQLINAGTYTVTVTPTDPNYTGSKEFTFTVNKAPHEKPVEDDLKIEVAWDSVTVTHDKFTVQLSKDGTDWVDTTMGGYDANTSYTLRVRFKEDANHSASSNTIMISGKTAERTAVEFRIAGVEEHYNRAVLTITFEEAFSGKVQFSIDGGKTWKDLTAQDGKYVASGLAESSEYTLQVKIPAGDDYLESEVKPVKVKTGIDPAKYTETLAMFGETFSAGDLVNYETLKEQFNGLTEADKAGVDAAKFATITAARDEFVASVNSDIEDIQNVAAKTAGRAVAAAAAAVTAAAIALFIAKRKFI